MEPDTREMQALARLDRRRIVGERLALVSGVTEQGKPFAAGIAFHRDYTNRRAGEWWIHDAAPILRRLALNVSLHAFHAVVVERGWRIVRC